MSVKTVVVGRVNPTSSLLKAGLENFDYPQLLSQESIVLKIVKYETQILGSKIHPDVRKYSTDFQEGLGNEK